MRAVTVAAIILVSACAPRDAAPRETPVVRVTLAQFGQLRWLEGRWRGAEQAGAPFFESYQFLDDSTIASYTYGDSTFTTTVDSGRIQFRGDSVTSGWPVAERVATAMDSASIAFSAPAKGGNPYSWHAEGPGAWSARLPWDSASVALTRVYAMRAVP